MTSSAATISSERARPSVMTTMALVLVGLAFAALFARPAALLVQDWWNDPEAGHGLLLAPAALWLAWRRGLVPDRTPNPALGLGIVGAAVAFRLAAELAAEFFVMRGAMVLGLAGLVVYYLGFRQARAWWLPIMLLALSVPLPELIRSSLALPLQFKASELGASLLDWRHVPVRLAGNVIQIPGHRLFVTEACSGLRSLTALLSLALLIGGIWFRRPALRVTLILLTIPIAVGINGIRVFLTGFLVYFVDPKLGEGFMHLTEGWLLFVVSFALVGVVAAGLSVVDRWWTARRKVESPA